MFKKKGQTTRKEERTRDMAAAQHGRDGVISIIGPGMKVVGNCVSEGTLRIDGEVEGSISAGKAVVVGKDSVIVGDITTQDAVIGGRVKGRIVAESRLELQATCVIEGEVFAKRIKLEEGGQVFGTIQMGEDLVEAEARREDDAPELEPAGG